MSESPGDADAPRPDTGWFDDETRLLGPRAWALILGVEAARCKRYGRAVTVVMIEVDGGLKVDNIVAVAHAGADTFVAGSAIFGTRDYAATIAAMRDALKSGG